MTTASVDPLDSQTYTSTSSYAISTRGTTVNTEVETPSEVLTSTEDYATTSILPTSRSTSTEVDESASTITSTRLDVTSRLPPDVSSATYSVTTEDQSPTGGLSDGAIAGIVIGSIAVVVIVIILICVCRNKQKQKKAKAMQPSTLTPKWKNRWQTFKDRVSLGPARKTSSRKHLHSNEKVSNDTNDSTGEVHLDAPNPSYHINLAPVQRESDNYTTVNEININGVPHVPTNESIESVDKSNSSITPGYVTVASKSETNSNDHDPNYSYTTSKQDIRDSSYIDVVRQSGGRTDDNYNRVNKEIDDHSAEHPISFYQNVNTSQLQIPECESDNDNLNNASVESLNTQQDETNTNSEDIAPEMDFQNAPDNMDLQNTQNDIQPVCDTNEKQSDPNIIYANYDSVKNLPLAIAEACDNSNGNDELSTDIQDSTDSQANGNTNYGYEDCDPYANRESIVQHTNTISNGIS